MINSKFNFLIIVFRLVSLDSCGPVKKYLSNNQVGLYGELITNILKYERTISNIMKDI